jgi:hypothetical protein
VEGLLPALCRLRHGSARHTAITENKRLGEVLSWIKSQQDEAPPKPSVKTNSEQIRYQQRGRKPGRRTDFMNDPAVIARREQVLARLVAAE